MNKLLLALLAMFLVLGLAYADDPTPTPCPKGTECATWETCSGGDNPECEPTKCTEEADDKCKGGFCRVEEGATEGVCEAKVTCPKYQEYKASDNTCIDIECDTSADCNAADKSTEGYCEGADATKTPAEKGKCVALCVQAECAGAWQECSETTNECEDIACNNKTGDDKEECPEETFCKIGDNKVDGVCMKNVCTANGDCGADGFCKKAEGAKAETEGVCEAKVTCPKYQKYQDSDNTCVDIACDTSADCNAADKSTEGYCEGADATKTPAVKGKCVALCVPDDCVKGSKCVTETNQCTPTKCGDTGDAECEAGSECVEKKCVPVKIELMLIGAKFNRSRADGADAAYDDLAKKFYDILNNEKSKCAPLDDSPVAYAKNSIGYYVTAKCDEGARKNVEDELLKPTPNPTPNPTSFITLEDAEVKATVELKSVGKFDESCITPKFDCGTEDCNFACGIGTKCTKEDAKLVCGDHQKCVIEDNATKGECANSAAIYSTLVAIVLAVAAIVF